MISYRVLGAAFLALMVSAPVLAQEAAAPQPATPPVAAEPAKPVKQKKVCRSEAVLGSNLPNMTCHTKDEWAAIDSQNRANVQNIRNSGGFQPH